MEKVVFIDGSQPEVVIDCAPNTTRDVVVLLTANATVRCVARVAANATVRWHSAILGGNVHCEIESILEGVAANSEHRGIFLGKQHDKFTLKYWNTHLAEHTIGHITIHGVLYDYAYADFKGNIVIQPTAVDTQASLTEHTLLLGDHARSDSIPELDIKTNAVQATHSSGITKIDDEQLFYCSSRGIPATEAAQMIVAGFLRECISDATIQAEVDKRLGYDTTTITN